MSKKATETAQELTYTQAIKQLEEITTRLQDPNCDIDL